MSQLNHPYELSFDDYLVGYDNGPKWLLNVRFPPGSITVLLGPNGSGKSTTAKAAAALLTRLKGRSYLNGISIDSLTLKQKRSFFLYIPQNPIWSFGRSDLHRHLNWFSSFLESEKNLDDTKKLLNLPTIICDLMERRFAEMNNEDIVVAALLEDFLLPRDVLILDECPDFEIEEYLDFFRHHLASRSASGRITVIGRHLEIPTNFRTKITQYIPVDELRYDKE